MVAKSRLADRLVLVTGSARGVGLATAKRLLVAGANPVLADVDEDAVSAASEQLPSSPPSYRLDIANPSCFRDVIDRIERDHGPLDALINNAGIMPIVRFDDESDATTVNVIKINLLGTIYGTREAFRRMRTRGRGHIINVASIAGRLGTPGLGSYSASKFGIVGYTEAVRAEARGTGVEFSVVLPGVVATRLSAGMEGSGLAKPIRPESVAEAIVKTLEKPRFEVYVPQFQRRLVATSAVVPTPLLDRIVRITGGDKVVLDALGSPARADYERSIAAVDAAADLTKRG
jgi:NAD(P)-dependent dehydrogenase (short-subunit alcohol dehydrogenase family)